VSKAEALLSPQARIAFSRAGTGQVEPCRCTLSRVVTRTIRRPVVCLESLLPKEVNRRTGFRDLKQLLSNCAVVYGGDIDKMSKTATYLTWLEEIMLWLEFTWVER